MITKKSENNFNSGTYDKPRSLWLAYKDGERYSIGYGTISYYGECITDEEAQKRSKHHIMQDYDTVVKVVGNNPNVLPVVLDIAYQYGTVYAINFYQRERLDFLAAMKRKSDYPQRWKNRMQYYQDSTGYATMFTLLMVLLIAKVVS